MIEFCECGNLMIPVKDIFRCRKCGSERKKNGESRITTEAKKENIIIIDDNAPSHLPVTDKECEKCGNVNAYYWLIQTRSSDEPPTQFFKCTNEKCKYIWREYK
ncbi:MAG: transcription factor S [Candidatus Aenigmarchaeota archaeon]|nr:transcription factor S [Candidatus Aenigmarchaeota archaeon]MDI6722441.1 transcription factor S [Candidatus Aenigmarchaeota archaeon]